MHTSSVRAATTGRRLVGLPYFLPPHLTAAVHYMLPAVLPELLQVVDLLSRICLLFMRGRNPQHFLFAFPDICAACFWNTE
jgi:hypothetical protein